MNEMFTVSREVVILNALGLHARPAASLVEAVSNLNCKVWIRKDDYTVNAKSLMGVLTLVAAQGTVLVITAEGKDAQRAVDRIVELVDGRFGEE
ncbi:MAG TPA: HPr family phosphocarrier protein [bacterium]|nr:HPr family phosphocarrier protein [bacterium]HPO09163.1 HPr family phosphocarrier protein [bacterium]HQO34746.1 HPr family phosphocarrier protein [bacterium]HQP97567.1 HPr family phosphocarrier protein [bacterium]